MLDVVLLGEFRVRSDGQLLTGLRSPRSQALVGYLAVHQGTPQARHRVAGLFWPDSTESQARTNLRRELHQLRQCLPDPDTILAVDQTSIWWRDNAPVQIDVTTFEAAADQASAALQAGDDTTFVERAGTAVAAYGGDFLPSIYDDWVLAERERLRRRCVKLLDQLIEVSDEDEAALVVHARRRVELEPLEEVGHRTLIYLLAQTGDRAAALQAYHRCLSVLERELDAPPSRETTQLYERLLARPEHATAAAPVRQMARRTSPFVGREHELGRLRAAWINAAAGELGSARLAVITGEAGVGKTRLAEELLAAVQQAGGAVARARCFAGERPLPLAPVAEWLRSRACRSGVEALEPAWRAEVARLLPELGTDAGAPGPADSWQRHRFFEGLVRAVLAVDRPVTLLLDDLQWCDADTLTWLELCLHIGAAAPLLLVATARSEELNDNPELVATLSRLRVAGMVTDVELGPLGETQTTELATLLLGRDMDPSLAARLHSLTEGFPLFVVEAVTHDGDGLDLPALGSPRVQAVLEGRLNQLNPRARELAGLAAAIGRDFSLELLIEASDHDADTVVVALDELWRRRIVREHTGATYDFSHDLLRAAAYDSLSPPQRRGLHRHVAQTLVRMHAEGTDTVAAHIADQYDRARMPANAIPYYLQAARAANQLFGYEQAVQLAERALTLLAGVPGGSRRDEQELQIRAISAGPRNALGGWTSPEARENLERIRELSERTGDRPALVESLVGLWGAAFVRGTLTAALALAERALATSGDNPDLAAYAHTAMAGSLTSAGEPRRALPHYELATRTRAGAGQGILGFAPGVMAWAWRAHADWLTGHVDRAREHAATAIDVAKDLGAPWGRAVAVAYAAITHQLRGDREEALARAQEIQELSARYEFAYYQHWGQILEGWLHGGTTGVKLITEGIRRLREHEVGSRLPYYLALLAETLLDDGQPAEARSVLATAYAEAEEHSDWWWLPELWRLEARLLPGPDGSHRLERAMAIAREQGSTSLGLRAAVDLAGRLVERGESDRARELVTPLRYACRGTSPELDTIDARLATLFG